MIDPRLQAFENRIEKEPASAGHQVLRWLVFLARGRTSRITSVPLWLLGIRCTADGGPPVHGTLFGRAHVQRAWIMPVVYACQPDDLYRDFALVLAWVSKRAERRKMSQSVQLCDRRLPPKLFWILPPLLLKINRRVLKF